LSYNHIEKTLMNSFCFALLFNAVLLDAINIQHNAPKNFTSNVLIEKVGTNEVIEQRQLIEAGAIGCNNDSDCGGGMQCKVYVIKYNGRVVGDLKGKEKICMPVRPSKCQACWDYGKCESVSVSCDWEKEACMALYTKMKDGRFSGMKACVKNSTCDSYKKDNSYDFKTYCCYQDNCNVRWPELELKPEVVKPPPSKSGPSKCHTCSASWGKCNSPSSTCRAGTEACMTVYRKYNGKFVSEKACARNYTCKRIAKKNNDLFKSYCCYEDNCNVQFPKLVLAKPFKWYCAVVAGVVIAATKDLAKAQSKLSEPSEGTSQGIIPMFGEEAGDINDLAKSWAGGAMWWFALWDVDHMKFVCKEQNLPE